MSTAKSPKSQNNANKDREQLLAQIETLKSIINQKTVQLNSVIKQSEEKYADIHDKYRLMANELHESWQFKYNNLQKENEKLLNCLTFLLNENGKIDKVSTNSNSFNELESITPSISNVGDFLNEDNVSNIFAGSNNEYID